MLWAGGSACPPHLILPPPLPNLMPGEGLRLQATPGVLSRPRTVLQPVVGAAELGMCAPQRDPMGDHPHFSPLQHILAWGCVVQLLSTAHSARIPASLQHPSMQVGREPLLCCIGGAGIGALQHYRVLCSKGSSAAACQGLGTACLGSPPPPPAAMRAGGMGCLESCVSGAASFLSTQCFCL